MPDAFLDATFTIYMDMGPALEIHWFVTLSGCSHHITYGAINLFKKKITDNSVLSRRSTEIHKIFMPDFVLHKSKLCYFMQQHV